MFVLVNIFFPCSLPVVWKSFMFEIEKRRSEKLYNVYYNVVAKSNLSAYNDLNIRLQQDFAQLEQHNKKILAMLHYLLPPASKGLVDIE